MAISNVIDLFDAQVIATPSNIAIKFLNLELTYKELSDAVNCLSGFFVDEYHIKPGDVIALAISRCELLPIAIIAILKIGATYVPLDLDGPLARFNHIINELNPVIVVTNKINFPGCANLSNVVDITSIANSDTRVDVNIHYNSLAYILYTSGTTSMPKGVMMRHDSCYTRIKHMIAINGTTTEDKVLFKTSYLFDVSFSDIFVTLCSGACLCITQNLFDIDEIIGLLDQHKITMCHFTPSQFRVLVDCNCVSNISKLRIINFSGEALTTDLLRYIPGDVKVVNYYGPTETGEVSYEIVDLFMLDARDFVSIGIPMPGVNFYVVDSSGQQVLDGSQGELWVSGVSVASGYFNLPNQTNFVPNPFSKESVNGDSLHDIIYKTGDMVYKKHGLFAYLGRNDDQVKVNGTRVNLSQIECIINQYPKIVDSVAITVGVTTTIIGYYVALDAIVMDDFQQYLANNLASGEIPVTLIQIDSIPLTGNGKIDKHKLLSMYDNKEDYVKPTNDLERSLCEIFTHVMQVPVGINSDLFALGLDSISAIKAMIKMRSIKLHIAVKDLLNFNTIKALSEYLSTFNDDILICTEDIHYQTPGSQRILATNPNIESVYLANSLQQGILYNYSNGHGHYYHEQVLISYKCAIDVNRFKYSWQHLTEIYATLRLSFNWDEHLLQLVHKQVIVDFSYFDVSSMDHQLQQEQLKQICQEDLGTKYYLEKGNLFRVYLIKYDQCSYKCLFSYNHIILDEWSIGLLLSRLHCVYLQELDGANDAYQVIQKYLQEHRCIDFKFWDHELAKIDNYNGLGYLFKKSKHSDLISYSKGQLIIQGDEYSKIELFAHTHKVTKNTILQYIWHKILSIFCFCKVTVVGTVLSGREVLIQDIDHAVGLIMNTLPLVVSHSNTRLSVLGALLELQSKIHGLGEQCGINLADLSGSAGALFDNLLVFNGKNLLIENDAMEATISYLNSNSGFGYPLAVVATELSDSLAIEFRYNDYLLSAETVESMIAAFHYTLGQIMHDPHVSQSQLNCVNSIAAVANNWIIDKHPIPDKTLHELFEEQVKKTPNKIALRYCSKCYTYLELNQHSNRVAHYLINNHQTNSIIALYCDHSDFMIIGMLAILKSGCAYVPLNTNDPDDRLLYIVEDTQSRCVLTTDKYVGKVKSACKKLCQIESIDAILKTHQTNIENPQIKHNQHNLAYVMYTSGTTGKPKGVLVEHIGAVNFINYTKTIDGLSSSCKMLLTVPYTFDISVWEIFWSLSSGHEAIIPQSCDSTCILEAINKYQINVIHFVPSLLSVFLALVTPSSSISSLRHIVLGGEAIDASTLHKCYALIPGISIHNFYGPTEASINATYYPLTPDGEIYIGKPIPNVSLYVLDCNMMPSPYLAVGELYIGGQAVARGYLNQDNLTKDKFFISSAIPALKDIQEQKIYKTGDLVRYTTSGAIEYLGRYDAQVKIHGIRIETEEIEAVLKKYPHIKDVAVTLISTPSKHLVAYYTTVEHIEQKLLWDYMLAKLPEHMIPSQLVKISAMPLLLNGKLNRKLLTVGSKIIENMPPRDSLERRMSDIFASVLNVPYVDTHDDFFAIGGNSITALMLSSRLSSELKIEITTKMLLSYRNVSRLYDHIHGN